MSGIAERMQRTVRIMVDEFIGSASAVVAQTARQRRDDLVRSGFLSGSYRTFVDGRYGAAEETVKLNRGEIIYLFSGLAAAVAFAVGYIKGISPVLSGDFQDSWFITVDGAAWDRSFSLIPAGSVVVLTNFAPYARILEQGRKKARRPGHKRGRFMTEAARLAIKKEFPNLLVERVFVNLAIGPGRHGWKVPYVLLRGENKGTVINYPAVRISER